MAQNMNNEALQATLRMIDKKGELSLEMAKQQNPAAAAKMEKLSELYQNEAFISAFAASKSAEEAAALFAENGLELTIEEVTAIAKQLREFTEKLIENGGELSESELEEIAGGMEWWHAVVGGAVGGAIVGGTSGTLVCPGVGTVIGGIVGGLFGAVGSLFSWLW